LYVEQDARSNVLVNGITLNNGLTRNNYSINIKGEGAETTLCGLSVQDRNQHVDTYTHLTHAVPRCKSMELFKSVLDEQSTSVFSGRILVKEGADKTEAFQINRNMCLTREARVYSKPQLEIYTDDVKCSHGMTTGQIDEQALFYMQSRGISREEARILLSVAFTSDVLDKIRVDPLKDRLRYLVERRFRGERARCDNCHCDSS
jgi:Fe-S cluster assembly protein SufD